MVLPSSSISIQPNPSPSTITDISIAVGSTGASENEKAASSTSSHSSYRAPKGLIMGGVVGGIVSGGLLLMAIFLLKRARKSQECKAKLSFNSIFEEKTSDAGFETTYATISRPIHKNDIHRQNFNLNGNNGTKNIDKHNEEDKITKNLQEFSDDYSQETDFGNS